METQVMNPAVVTSVESPAVIIRAVLPTRSAGTFRVELYQEVARQRANNPFSSTLGFSMQGHASFSGEPLPTVEKRVGWQNFSKEQVASLGLSEGVDLSAVLAGLGYKVTLVKVEVTELKADGDQVLSIIPSGDQTVVRGFGGIYEGRVTLTPSLNPRTNGFLLTDSGKLIFRQNMAVIVPMDTEFPSDVSVEGTKPFTRNERKELEGFTGELVGADGKRTPEYQAFIQRAYEDCNLQLMSGILSEM